MVDSTFVNLAKDLAMFAKDTFTNIAPEVWEMVARKITVIAYTEICAGVVISIISIIAFIYGIKKAIEPLIVIPIIVFIVIAPLIIVGVIELYAIDYYTLKAVMELIH